MKTFIQFALLILIASSIIAKPKVWLIDTEDMDNGQEGEGEKKEDYGWACNNPKGCNNDYSYSPIYV